VNRQPYNLDYPKPREGAMIRRQLQQMVDDATALQTVLHPDDNVPAWTQTKIATAQDRLHVASRYLRSRISDYGAAPVGASAFDRYKPYLPWAIGLGLVALTVYMGRESSAPSRKRRSESTKRRKRRATKRR